MKMNAPDINKSDVIIFANKQNVFLLRTKDSQYQMYNNMHGIYHYFLVLDGIHWERSLIDMIHKDRYGTDSYDRWFFRNMLKISQRIESGGVWWNG